MLSRADVGIHPSGLSGSLHPATEQAVPYKNIILQHLPADSVARLKLQHVQLPVKSTLEDSERSIEHISFIEAGLGSMTSTFHDGTKVGVGLFGYESVIGISAFMGLRRSLNRINMQIAGSGYAAEIADARAEFNLRGTFQELSLRYVQMQLTQATQTAACNARHGLEQRLARWLLLRADRCGSPEVALSQHGLAIMLGVQRTSIALTMGRFRENELIAHTRGRILLTDVSGLEAAACECHAVLKDYLNNYVGSHLGFAV